MSTTETVLITGASSGIGLELVKCFAKNRSRLILVARNTDALEKLAEVKALIFDKTGTLTLGSPEVVDIQTTDITMKKDVAKTAASLDQLSAHVLAASLTKYAIKNYEKQYRYKPDAVKSAMQGQNISLFALLY